MTMTSNDLTRPRTNLPPVLPVTRPLGQTAPSLTLTGKSRLTLPKRLVIVLLIVIILLPVFAVILTLTVCPLLICTRPEGGLTQFCLTAVTLFRCILFLFPAMTSRLCTLLTSPQAFLVCIWSRQALATTLFAPISRPRARRIRRTEPGLTFKPVSPGIETCIPMIRARLVNRQIPRIFRTGASLAPTPRV